MNIIQEKNWRIEENRKVNCKHCKVQGNTTKYFYCQLKGKAIDEYMCKNCVMKLPDLPNVVEEILGGLNKR